MASKQALMLISSVIIFLLGCVHLLYTFWGPKLLPRDPQLISFMQTTALVITKETTVWKAWIGFNASHSMGAMLFGLIYAHLSLMQPALLFTSVFLQIVGALMLVGFLILAWLFWFSVPFVGVAIALVAYLSGLFLARL